MKPEWNDEKIKALFLELKRAEGRQAPDFAQVCTAAVARAGRRQWPGLLWPGLAAAALLALLGIAVVLLFHRPAQGPKTVAGGGESISLPWRTAVLISEWHSPTDFLLENPIAPVWQTDRLMNETLNHVPTSPAAGKN